MQIKPVSVMQRVIARHVSRQAPSASPAMLHAAVQSPAVEAEQPACSTAAQ
jgi:hypothetical protein